MLKFSPVIADAQGLITMWFIGVPAFLVGVACIVTAWVLGLKVKDEAEKAQNTIKRLWGAGLLLFALAIFSPTLGKLLGI